MGNCSPKSFHEPPPAPVDGVWYVDGPSIPEPLESEYMKRCDYEPIWVRPLPAWLEPLKPLNEPPPLNEEIKPFRGKLAPLKLC